MFTTFPRVSNLRLNYFPMKFWLTIFILLGASLSYGATKNGSPPAVATTAVTSEVPVTSSRASAIPPVANLGPVAQGAAQNGIRRCLSSIDQVSGFLSAGAQTGAMVFAPPIEADNRLSSVSLEVLGNNGLSYIDTSYAPNATGCDAMYQTVTYWTNSCDEVARVAFPSFKKSGPLRQYVAVLDGGPSAKVFLMPAGAGCVSIKKEVLY